MNDQFEQVSVWGPRAREAQEFVSCIQEKRQPAVNAEDGLQSTKIALACQESFDTKSLVQLKK